MPPLLFKARNTPWRLLLSLQLSCSAIRWLRSTSIMQLCHRRTLPACRVDLSYPWDEAGCLIQRQNSSVSLHYHACRNSKYCSEHCSSMYALLVQASTCMQCATLKIYTAMRTTLPTVLVIWSEINSKSTAPCCIPTADCMLLILASNTCNCSCAFKTVRICHQGFWANTLSGSFQSDPQRDK